MTRTLVNLFLFSVEIERSRVDEPSADHLSAAESSSQRPVWLRRIAVTVAVLVCAFAAACGGWVLAGGDTKSVGLPDWFPLTAGSPQPGSEQVRLELTSQPDEATVILDGHSRGQTPISVLVKRGEHTLVLRHPDAIDEQRTISVSSDLNMRVGMWLRRPTAVQLRPAYPGASIADAAFLADGRLALSLAVPSQAGSAAGGILREPWLFDPTTGSLSPFVADTSARAAVLSISPDGRNVAYLRQDQSGALNGVTRQRLDGVWIGSVGGTPARVFALPTPNALGTADPASNEVEELRDVTWTPDGDHLLVAVRLLAVSGGYPAAARTRLLLVDARAQDAAPAPPVELVVLPAEVVPGSYSWAPDGHWVAFLSDASEGSGSGSFVALCAVDTSAGGAVDGFRYVADLGRQTDPSSLLPVAAVAWAPASDGRLVYVAATPKITVTNPLGLPGTSGGEPGLFLATPTGPALTAEEGRRLGTTTGLMAPAWRATTDEGVLSLIALARSEQGNKPLVLRGVDAVDGKVQDLGIELPAGVGGSGAFGVRWDLPQGRLLILSHRDGMNIGVLDYWLVQLRPAEGGE